MNEFVDGLGSDFLAPEAQWLLAPRFSVGNCPKTISEPRRGGASQRNRAQTIVHPIALGQTKSFDPE